MERVLGFGLLYLLSLVSHGWGQSCLILRSRVYLDGGGDIFRAQMVGLPRKDCFAKCALDKTRPPCKAAYYFQRAEGGAPLCHHFVENSASPRGRLLRSPRSHQQAALAEVRRPCPTKAAAAQRKRSVRRRDVPTLRREAKHSQAQPRSYRPQPAKAFAVPKTRSYQPPRQPSRAQPSYRGQAAQPRRSYQGAAAPPSSAARTAVAAPWAAWSNWSACPRYGCDGIQRQRQRRCGGYGGKGCYGAAQEQQPCQCQPAPQWGAWGAYGACDRTCGTGGQMQRARRCSVQGQCPGPARSASACRLQPCPQWAAWSGYGPCSKTCGSGGTRQRTRGCNYGQSCPGKAADTSACPRLPPCAAWTVWGSYGACTATCGGGYQVRSRRCQGGTVGRDCLGDERQSNKCQQKACAAWTAWGSYGACTASCGGGSQVRSRQCRGGMVGRDCQGDSRQSAKCEQRACPTWNDWAPWSPCSATCGNGQHQRQRKCSYAQCASGQAADSGQCYAGPCPTTPPPRQQPRCEWTQWGEYGACSVTCGQGLQSRRRLCTCYQGCGSGGSEGKVQSQPCAMGPCGGYSGNQFANTYQGHKG